MEKIKTILCLMDYGKDCRTGFATVSRNIKKEIKKAFGEKIRLQICAINHYGENYTEEDGTLVFSAKLNDVRQDDFGRYAFLKIVNDSDEYDGIFIIQDLGVIQPIIPILESIKQKKKSEGKKQFKTIWYFPVDCHLFPSLTRNLEFFDTLVTYTDFGREEILKFRPELRGKIKVINHGCNLKEFYPLSQEEKKSFRESYFGKNADKFIITNVNRNQPRKDLPNTIFGFIEAKRDWKRNGLDKEPFLYLHCQAQDPLGHDLRAVLMQTELVEYKDFMLLPKQYESNLLGIDMLNGIYNASDVYITTTLGEGWGLTITEAFSTKLPVIAPNTTSIPELSGNGSRAYLLETIIPYCGTVDNIVREQTDHWEIGEKIIEVANDINVRSLKLNDKIDRAYEYANSLDWSMLCKRWVEYFKETYKIS
jgi:glycosyltransferase involved in cell wall biosynthesis